MAESQRVRSEAFELAAAILNEQIREHGLEWSADRVTPHQIVALEALVATYRKKGYPVFEAAKEGIHE